jgi:hypothetical protein
MLRQLLFIFSCINFVTLYSQGNILYDFRSEYQTGYYHIFGDKVNIRSAADKNAEVLKQLTIGDSIKVTKITDEQLVMNGLEYPWIQVEWTANKQKKTGFIWGALLSFYHEKFSSESGINYAIYLGPLKYDPADAEFLGEARLCSNGAILDSRSFKLHVSKSKTQAMQMGMYKNEYRNIPKSYRNIEYILSVNLTVESCGPSGIIYVLVNEGEILFAGSELGSFSGGDFSEGNEFVFPWDKGGMKEKIFEYYSYYSAEYEDHPEEDTTYLMNIYSKKSGEFVLTKTYLKD